MFSKWLPIILFRSEYLVQNKYAAPGKVAINGASNGGTRLSRYFILFF